jgi:hypothetical protein
MPFSIGMPKSADAPENGPITPIFNVFALFCAKTGVIAKSIPTINEALMVRMALAEVKANETVSGLVSRLFMRVSF